MKITSTDMPQTPFKVRNGKAVFYSEVSSSMRTDSMTGGDVTVWSYERYELPVKETPNLCADIGTHYNDWLLRAKDYERTMLSEKIRDRRDELLNICDVKYCNSEKWDSMTDEQKAGWRAYKQALRDIPEQEGFPYRAEFPEVPYQTEE
ncbi:phage tail assembly chaperone [Marasmitruncus massiliensis]|uniref:phage tail assembly chaperone n=1 Tax=Marasmitruncus massiliensis TaxID=1944642 RepID=UPI0011AF8E2E|nr:phage tail assembly chaperone [Marasmitruncus massiliensis]